VGDLHLFGFDGMSAIHVTSRFLVGFDQRSERTCKRAIENFTKLEGARSMKTYATIITIMMLLSGHTAMASEPRVIVENAHTLLIKSVIDAALFDEYKDKITPEIDTLVITSTGGDVNYGIKLGNDVFDRKLNVVVRDYCISSCANYIFLAGNKKSIENNSIIGFHGTSFSIDGGEEIRKFILDAKGDHIKIDDFMNFVKTNNINSESMENYIQNVQFFSKIKSNKNILFDFFGTVAVDEQKYDVKTPYEDFVLWPSSKKLKQCYGVSNVDDRFRPKNEFRLNEGWQSRHPKARLLIGGDNFFDGCKSKLSKRDTPMSCEVNTTHGVDAQGLTTTIETKVCR
jgi:ATP-dependent protease ClpP protease subunit